MPYPAGYVGREYKEDVKSDNGDFFSHPRTNNRKFSETESSKDRTEDVRMDVHRPSKESDRGERGVTPLSQREPSVEPDLDEEISRASSSKPRNKAADR